MALPSLGVVKCLEPCRGIRGRNCSRLAGLNSVFAFECCLVEVDFALEISRRAIGYEHEKLDFFRARDFARLKGNLGPVTGYTGRNFTLRPFPGTAHYGDLPLNNRCAFGNAAHDGKALEVLPIGLASIKLVEATLARSRGGVEHHFQRTLARKRLFAGLLFAAKHAVFFSILLVRLCPACLVARFLPVEYQLVGIQVGGGKGRQGQSGNIAAYS